MMRGEIVLRPPEGALPGVDATLAAVEGVARESVVRLEWGREARLTVLYHLTGDDGGAVRAALDGDELAQEYHVETVGEDRIYGLIHGESTELMARLMAAVEMLPMVLEPPFRCTGDGWRIPVVGPEDTLQRAHGLATDHVDVTVERLGAFAPRELWPLFHLTDRQRQALQTAHAIGFYEQPQEAGFEDVAEELDCARSTANRLLRRAEARLVDAVAGE